MTDYVPTDRGVTTPPTASSSSENDWKLVADLVCSCKEPNCPRRAVVDRLRAAQPKATAEAIWTIAYRGETDDLAYDEYWEVRDYAEDVIDEIRGEIASGRYPAEDFEPMILMEGTLTKYRSTEGDWKPVTPPGQRGDA